LIVHPLVDPGRFRYKQAAKMKRTAVIALLVCACFVAVAEAKEKKKAQITHKVGPA
jgi:hypothetical protein